MSKHPKPLPPVDELLHIFFYEDETGKLFWRNPRSSNTLDAAASARRQAEERLHCR